ncbi:MAG: TIGR04283 family arsenosugar biosynthesis glycosyltransferase [Betaproteobacteria bacterium]|nr:MAG: TIGR04283 family arsenosugar biosynthesis glycosyltransferase [Betaproteobacteria bacterium]
MVASDNIVQTNNSPLIRTAPLLSFIVPVLNEADSIECFLQTLRACCGQQCEIIVVDGGSNDATTTLATPYCDQVIVSARGRAMQMNAGARCSSGALLCFVHADSTLPPAADQNIRAALGNGGRQWGRFDVRLSGRHPLLRIVERLMNWRSRLTGIATGDQALFMTRELFESAGGFPEIALMEDIAMSRKLKSLGPPACLSKKLIASARRWEQNGVMRTIVLMWKLRLLYFLGADPARLAQRYYGRGV